jgi:hypothetical protein
MKAVIYIIDCLERTPTILLNLLDQIPEEMYSNRRMKNKWSIHEQVCHLVEAQTILTGRFKQFETEELPLIKAYHPPIDRSPSFYLEMDMKAEVERFPQIRANMVKMLKGFDGSYWKKEGRHEMYTPYNAQLLLTHALNVDYAHIFSIEQLGLSKTGFENEIMTIP